MKENLHPLNKHRSGYDFDLLVKSFPDLAEFVFTNQYGNQTINYADPKAVKWLNKALLKAHYGIEHWDLPKDYLVPPIPGRVDYIHYMASHLANLNNRKIPKGANIKVLDIGVGSNCIYPILGHKTYGWHFIGSDIDKTALENAQKIVNDNPDLSDAIEIRSQIDKKFFFKNIVQAEDYFDLTFCNPPYHLSEKEALTANQRKNKNLGIDQKDKGLRNFGGQSQELWYEGGELLFVKQMIQESLLFKNQFFCFSSIISKKEHLYPIEKFLKKLKITDFEFIKMSQGQKIGRILVWSLLTEKQKKAWVDFKWR